MPFILHSRFANSERSSKQLALKDLRPISHFSFNQFMNSGLAMAVVCEECARRTGQTLGRRGIYTPNRAKPPNAFAIRSNEGGPCARKKK